MKAGVTKHLLDRSLAQALRDYGLYAEAEIESPHTADIPRDISLYMYGETGALNTMWCAEADLSECTKDECVDEAIDSLLKRKEVKFAVAVRYPDDLASNSIEEARYVWRMKPRSGAKSGLMSGGIAALALAISLVYGSPREPGPVARRLAGCLVEDDPDVLAVALPYFTATGDSRMDVRQRLQEDYRVLFVLASHDPEQPCFSRDGRGPEVLVVCKPRTAVQAAPRGSMIINLTRNPANSEEARTVASDILNCIESGTDLIQSGGTIREVHPTELYAGDWSAAQFISPLLRELLRELTSGGLFPSAMLSAFADVGPTGGTVRGAFLTECPTPVTREFIALWGQDNSDVQVMKPNAESPVWAHPDPERSVNATKHWEKSSNLLFPVAPYLPKARTMAVRLDKPTLGSMWTNARMTWQAAGYEADYERALCVYMNSTLGILSMLGSFKRMGLLFRLESTARDLMALPVPDFVKMNGSLEALTAAFDELGECELSPLPESGNCSMRRAIDRAVCEALGISEELIHRIRSHLVREPSVTGKRYQIEERQLPLF